MIKPIKSDAIPSGLAPPDVTTAHAIHMLLGGIAKLTWRQIEERVQEVHPGLTGMHLGVGSCSPASARPGLNIGAVPGPIRFALAVR